MALLDGTVVNIALRSIGDDLGASLAELQWVVNAYLLALASLILVGGSLGDRLGRRRVFMVGVAWFAVASALCGLAQSPTQLIAARLLQGVGAALLTPGSLAMIQGSFRPQDRGAVIGQWAGLGGIAAAIGPLLGGWIVDNASWRWIFLINVPIAAVVLLVSARHVPESRDPEAAHGFDVLGAALGAVGLGGVTYALIEAETAAAWVVTTSAAAGVAAMCLFVVFERRHPNALVPMHLFASRTFSIVNLLTLLVYGALGAMMFFLVLQLQVVAGWSPLAAGMSTVPLTILMLLFSSRAGAFAARVGPRLPLAAGPFVCGAGVLLLREIGADASYWFGVLPGMLVFSAGLVLLVAPLTSTVLAAAPDRYAGIASGVNNAVARTGSLLAVSALPALVGIGGEDYQRPSVFETGYQDALLICAVLLFAGGLVAAVGLHEGQPAAATAEV
ncbi:MAG: MFS transporter [Nocardioidaceae bacterium]|nr:MFS transporter [Nocardioidaceae bacterium]NUS49634.1 MFS transporter [Nocardioidaceae bacterium]